MNIECVQPNRCPGGAQVLAQPQYEVRIRARVADKRFRWIYHGAFYRYIFWQTRENSAVSPPPPLGPAQATHDANPSLAFPHRGASLSLFALKTPGYEEHGV